MEAQAGFPSILIVEIVMRGAAATAPDRLAFIQPEMDIAQFQQYSQIVVDLVLAIQVDFDTGIGFGQVYPVIKIGKPPALLGDSQSLTFRAMKKTSILEPFKVSGKEVISGSSKPKPFNMGMQLSCGMDTQIQEEENIQGNTDRFGNCSA